MQTRAVRIHTPGGPEALTFETIELPPLAAGEARIRQNAIGVNFIDVYHRTGLYPLPLPAIIGSEGAGEVIEVGPGVTVVAKGDRVAYGGVGGAYAEVRNIAADRLVKLPSGVEDKTAAAAMLKGMTASYLVTEIGKLTRGTTIVVHAAAGGTGKLVVEWAHSLGARIVAIVSSRAKAEVVARVAKGAGPNELRTVVTSEADFVKETLDFTGGAGADIVYDSVGKDTFLRSFDCLRLRGLMVSFGQASGSVPPFELGLLSKKSLTITRPSLFHYTHTRADLEARANDLFRMISAQKLHIDIDRTFPLAAVADAHRALESRSTTGSLVLLPGAA
jgi:NADPH2:quinone reductase